ncbi:MAG: pyridoxamine 5'-phosphate oxidase family protein [Melioribacteraceae bacterium]|jgi:nitroimidazol reductase NimA-like FMN-containing flavoprotein (pyridoxamine 5'-phosphate oxidase superfamily)|nr:pyridoxamine 5'-phosphate oxidase family protein [Melioribacteraceae bacterium]
MRRSDRAISEEETMQLLNNCEYGILSTVSANGEPYGVPLSYCVVGNAIYFHSALEGRKLDNIQNNESVSFCVIGKTEVLQQKFSTKYESVIVSGNIEEAKDDDKQIGLEGLIKKYSPEYIPKGFKYIDKAKHETKVLKLKFKSITGKAHR